MWIFNHFVPCNGCPIRRFLQVIFDIVNGIANESAWVWACPEFGPWEMAQVGSDGGAVWRSPLCGELVLEVSRAERAGVGGQSLWLGALGLRSLMSEMPSYAGKGEVFQEWHLASTDKYSIVVLWHCLSAYAKIFYRRKSVISPVHRGEN